MILNTCHAEDYYELSSNVTHRTVSGIEAYRSALTLDWLADEDSRQRELAHVFETKKPMLPKELDQSECMTYLRPAPGKVARLILELLKNIEGDDGVIQELIKTLVRTKLLLENSKLEAEPDLESLVDTPAVMQGEPHVTLPRLMAVVWTLATDPVATEASGWCNIKKISQYLMVAPPTEIAARMRAIDPIIARARFIIEEFMQIVNPLHMQRTSTPMDLKPKPRRYKKRHRYVPTRSTLSDVFCTISTTTVINNDIEKMPNNQSVPIRVPMQMKTGMGVQIYSSAACVISNLCVCLVMYVLMS